MRLLITRPLHQVHATLDVLQSDGHQCITSPMLNRQFLDLPQPTGKVQMIVFTSRNAVEGLARLWSGTVPDHITAYAVGTATREAAIVAGFSKTIACSGNARDLVAEVSSSLQLKAPGQAANLQILYPCALQPAHDLVALFALQGLNCSAWPVYKMEETEEFSSEARSALLSGQVDGVLLYSARSAKTFAKLFLQLESPAKIPELFAFSESICNVLPLTLAKTCRFAKKPHENELRLILTQNEN